MSHLFVCKAKSHLWKKKGLDLQIILNTVRAQPCSKPSCRKSQGIWRIPQGNTALTVISPNLEAPSFQLFLQMQCMILAGWLNSPRSIHSLPKWWQALLSCKGGWKVLKGSNVTEGPHGQQIYTFRWIYFSPSFPLSTFIPKGSLEPRRKWVRGAFVTP